MLNNTVSLHRVLKAKPEKVYRAFTDAKAYAAWLPPYGYVAEVHEMDTRVGGNYKMLFTNFSTGSVQSFGGKYVAMEPDTFLQYMHVFDKLNLPGEMITTIWFKKCWWVLKLSLHRRHFCCHTG